MRVILPVLAVLAAGAASAAPSPEQTLAKLIEGRAAGKPVNCIHPEAAVEPIIIDGQAIVYRSTGTVYVARPAGACPELRSGGQLITRSVSGLLCRNQQFQIGFPPGPSGTGYCAFGSFTPYTRPR